MEKDDDAYGEIMLASARSYGLDTSHATVIPGAVTSHTHVMSCKDTGRRTFFAQLGCNNLMTVEHLMPPEASNARLYYLGSPGTARHLDETDGWRTLLKAGSAAIGRPLLDAMVPAATALAQTAAIAKPRMGFFYLPHGAIMENTRYGAEVNRWTPDKVGRDFDFKPILEPFKPFAKHLTVVSGLGNKPAESSAVHAIVPATWLSATHPRQSHAPYAGVTIDQIAAQHIGQDTPLPSLEVATEEEGGGAACDGTYGCAYGRTISFRTPTTPMPMEFDARKAFEKIFGRGKSDEQRKAVSKDYQSLLDMVLGEAGSLKKALGPADRSLVDDYLDSVREIERRIELMSQRDLTKVALPDVPVARPSFDALLRLQFDLIAAAFQANMTRIVSFMMAAEVSNMSYAHIGIPDAFHPLSHHADNKASMEKLAKLQRYHTSVFADFLEAESTRRHLDYRQLLGWWADAFGEQAIRVVIYPPAEGVLTAFLDAAGLPRSLRWRSLPAR